ncbi:MAG TPA: DivIVA domain-containing protein [Solirubrobacteraceae bacterium]|nr:DivIVA domain-containing protein [Solirubrobacteraceae bacterium]
MALDRQSIEKRDFPIGRRGYEPAAVDAHLATLAREVESLKHAKTSEAAAPAAEGRRSGESLASVASSQVQAIVEAAEASAYAIEREARDLAEQTAKDATRDAQRTRDEAVQRSQEHVGKVHEATSLMLQRVDAMESELNALVEALRTGANRLNADLSLLSGNMGELYDASGRSAPAAADAPIVEDLEITEAPTPPPPAASSPARPPAPEPEAPAAPPAQRATPPAAAPRGADAAAGAGDDDDDVEGARLIALNMALNGQSRDETDRYLAENFDLSDRAALLDEVYATVEG